MNFRYRQYEIPDGRESGKLVTVYRPVIAVTVSGPSGDLFQRALVDTGADFSILPLSIAPLLGITLDPKNNRVGESATGHNLAVSIGKVTLEITQGRERYHWVTEVGFALLGGTYHDEDAILGHGSFLDFFTATFDGKKHELALKPNSRLPKR